MTHVRKQAIGLYEPLIAFANAEITENNWEKVWDGMLSKTEDIWSQTPRERLIRPHQVGDKMLSKTVWSQTPRERLISPHLFEGKPIDGPEPFRIVQRELHEDFDKLIDPNKQLEYSEVKFSEHFLEGKPIDGSERFLKKRAVPPELLPPQEKRKDLGWLLDRIQRAIPVFRIDFKKERLIKDNNPYDKRFLLTDFLLFSPRVSDLRAFVYFGVANLWRERLLSQLGRCKRCQQFFLARTRAKKEYCSQRCAQALTAVDRARESRVRRRRWEEERKKLSAVCGDINKIYRKEKPQRPLTERQLLEEAEEAKQSAEKAFPIAFPRRKGPGYMDGKKLLAEANEQIKRLRKRVKEY